MDENDSNVINSQQDKITRTSGNLDAGSGTSKQVVSSVTSKSNKSRLKPAVRIAIDIFVVIVTFIAGLTIGIFAQSNLNSDDDMPLYPDKDRIVAEKPMIYLYPEEETEVSVQLGKPELLTTTYPKYNNGWQVLAKPDGTLNDKFGREFYGLYWEGVGSAASVHEDGFVIPGADSAKFLEEKLAVLGLTEREANEFIVYWLPKLESSPYNYIRFETRDEIENYMPLEVSPKPNSTIRIIMDYKPLSEPIEVSEQQLETPIRTGFTVVEWGGTQIGENLVH